MQTANTDDPDTTLNPEHTSQDSQTGRSPTPSELVTLSCASNSSTASTIRRRRILDLKIEAAERVAQTELSKIQHLTEIQQKLINRKLELQTAAIEADERRSRASSRASSRAPSRVTSRASNQAGIETNERRSRTPSRASTPSSIIISRNRHVTPAIINNSEHTMTIPAISDKIEMANKDQPYYTESLPSAHNKSDKTTTPVATRLCCSGSVPPTQCDSDLNKFLARQTSAKDLPFFAGDPEDWPMFFSQFTSTTRLCKYSDDENIARLSKCLKGRARDSVFALLVSATNLNKIIETLKLKFGRPDYLIEVMLTKVRDIRNIRHDDINQLIDFATIVQNVVATMTMTNEVGHLTNPTLIREAVNKLPSNLKYEWSFHLEQKKIKTVTLDSFADWLMMVATAATHIAPLPASSHNERQNQPKFDRKPAFTKPIFATTTPTTTTKKTCIMCKNSHDLKDCFEFKHLSIDDRWKFVTTKKLCFSCLLSKHQLRTCKTKTKCTKTDCNRVHHRFLHSEPKPTTTNDEINNEEISSSTDHDEAQNVTVNHLENNRTVLLKVVRVVISGKNGDVETSCLLDEGAAVSLIDTSLAARAGIDGPTRPLRIVGAHGMTSEDPKSKSISFKVRGRSAIDSYTLCNVRTVDKLELPVNTLRHKTTVNRFTYFKDYFDDADLNFDKVELLIGQDNIDLIVTREIIQGPTNAPIISKTRLGYVIHGNFASSRATDDTTVLHVCSCEQLNDTIKKKFTTEDFGVKLPAEIDVSRSREDKRALEIMQATTRFVGDRYETGLLWRSDHPVLPDSREQAYNRLQGIKRKMTRLPEFTQRYEEKINDYVTKGYASKLTPEEADVKTDTTWYLPHFAVINPNKPNKLRFILDAAAKTDGKSLNHFLLPGPDFLNYLPGTLLGFRCRKWAIIGDIQEMFHQVLIREEDRHSQRFLWGDDEYQMNVMIFGAICSPSSAQYVKNVNAERFKETHPRAVHAITNCHYMDDFIDSVDTEDQALQLVKDVIYIHKSGGFNMTGFISNSKTILKELPADKVSNTGLKILSDTNEALIERVLGVLWNPEDDNFLFQLNLKNIPEELKNGEKRPTKREVLKVTMSVFDPLGFLLHVTIKARMLLQDIWRSKIGWDDEIETPLYDRWKNWLQQLMLAGNFRVPRWLLNSYSDLTRGIEIHIFCDASSRAFTSLAYIRSQQQDGIFYVSLVMARGRVAPLKVLSIPRLELQAALMGARMAQMVIKYINLPISRVVYWSDSKTVLSWIRSEAGRFKPFVAHRISEIAELTEPDQWRWVPTDMNHADDATRENAPEDSMRWFKGPEFLRQNETAWPLELNSIADIYDSETDIEIKQINLTLLPNADLPDVRRFSSYWRLIRTTAWILRVIYNIKNRTNKLTGELSAGETSDAEILWYKESQKKFFHKELLSLRALNKVSKDSTLYQLCPFLDESGIIRTKGRIDAADVNFNVKNPIILHPEDRFVQLLINQYHKDVAHSGKELVLSNLRQKFWIIRGRSAVKRAFRDCQYCKVKKMKTDNTPQMGQIPETRLTTSLRPFAFTGLDYFGPMTIKIGRRREKRYCALFTCLTVRAIHLELVSDLSTNSALLAVRRFLSRRGTPREIWTDNASTFKGAESELRKAVEDLDQNVIRQFYSTHRVQWKFIAPNSPHHGGCWERMVRSVKTALKETLRERVPTEDTLLTLLAEAEFMVNSRPLTHVSLDHEDDPPLTPNHFLLTHVDDVYHPMGRFNDSDLIKKSWRESQRLADLLWRRWLKEYLPTLNKRGKWFREVENLKVGDIVVIADHQLTRNLWPKGKIVKVYPGPDQKVRIVDVRTTDGTYKRPVTKLCRLDISDLTST